MSRNHPVPCSRAEVEAARGAIAHYLYGPAGMAARLDPTERGLLAETVIIVQDRPGDEDLALANAAPDEHLLGLFTAGPGRNPTIQVFVAEAKAADVDPVDIFTHEAGHRFGYDHTYEETAVKTFLPDGGPRTLPPRSQVLASSDSDCPLCLLHARTAEVMGLLDGLRERSHLLQRIPPGAGGVIPLARRKTLEALDLLAVAGPLVPQRQDRVARLRQELADLADRLGRWMEPRDVSHADDVAKMAHDDAWDLNHYYWMSVVEASATG